MIEAPEAEAQPTSGEAHGGDAVIASADGVVEPGQVTSSQRVCPDFSSHLPREPRMWVWPQLFVGASPLFVGASPPPVPLASGGPPPPRALFLQPAPGGAAQAGVGEGS